MDGLLPISPCSHRYPPQDPAYSPRSVHCLPATTCVLTFAASTSISCCTFPSTCKLCKHHECVLQATICFMNISAFWIGLRSHNQLALAAHVVVVAEAWARPSNNFYPEMLQLRSSSCFANGDTLMTRVALT